MDHRNSSDKMSLDLSKTTRNVDKRERNAQSSHEKNITFVYAFASIIAPILEAILVAILTNLSNSSSLKNIEYQIDDSKIWIFSYFSLFVIILLIVVCGHIWSAVLHLQHSNKNSHYFDYKDIKDTYQLLLREYTSLRDSTKSILSSRIAINLSTIALEDQIAAFRSGTKLSEIGDPSNLFEPILWPFIRYREDIFGFNNGAIYNFALYMHSRSDDTLKLEFRDCDARIPRSDRSWKPGKGHVGLAFSQKELKICNNVAKSSELTTSKKDTQYYMSFASIPILLPEDSPETDDQALGVLVVTSSHADQFNEEIVALPLMTLSKLIGIILHEVFRQYDGEKGDAENEKPD